MLEATAIAGVLRNAADELDKIAAEAHRYELGTLRRQVRGIVVAVASFAEGTEP